MPGGPTGLWEKFAPGPGPEGAAELTVLVADATGAPVAGADVWLAPPDVLESRTSVSYGDLRPLGRTDAAGRLVAARLPEGRATVVADLERLCNTPRGLEPRAAAAVTLLAGVPARAELRLSHALADLGTIEGTVNGPGNRPCAGATVSAGARAATTDASGDFRLLHVAPGEIRIQARRAGCTSISATMRVRAGETLKVAMALTWDEPGGLRLAGRVLDPEGHGVAGATVYLIGPTTGGTGTLRVETTDAEGGFAMAALADRLATAPVRLQVGAKGFRTAVQLFDTLPTTDVELRLLARTAELALTLRDARSGAPLTRCWFETRDATERSVASFSSWNAEGRFSTTLPTGTLRVRIEAPDHVALDTTWDVPAVGGDFPREIRLDPGAANGPEVTLTVVVTAAGNGTAITACRLALLDPVSGAARVTLDQTRAEGRFPLPVPAGDWRLRVVADGYVTAEQGIRVVAGAAAEIRVALTAK